MRLKLLFRLGASVITLSAVPTREKKKAAAWQKT
jgi:hypothetical protein